MTQPWTEEGAQQVIYDAMFNAPPCRHWAMSIPCLSCLSKIAAAALSSANRLVPPGSEVREEWGVYVTEDYALDARDEARARHIAEQEGGRVESRKVITTPWSPSVPDTESEPS